MTFETFEQGDEETWPDQNRTMAKTNTKKKTMTKTNTFREHLQGAILVMRRQDLTKKKNTGTMTNTETKTMTKTNTFREHLQRAILESCVLCQRL